MRKLVLAGIAMWAVAGCGEGAHRSRVDSPELAKAAEAAAAAHAAAKRADAKARFKAGKLKAGQALAAHKAAHAALNAERERRGLDPVPLPPCRPAAKAWFDAGKAAGEVGETTIAVKHYERAVAADPTFRDAHLALGNVRYQISATHLTLRLEGLLEEVEPHHDTWVSKARFAELKALETRLASAGRAELQRRAEDPEYARRAKHRAAMGATEVLKSAKWDDRAEGPFLLFTEQGMSDAARARIDAAFAQLPAVLEAVRRQWGEPAGRSLPASPLFKIILLKDAARFRAFCERTEVAIDEGDEGYYDPRNRWVIGHGGAVQPLNVAAAKLADHTFMHVMTHAFADALVNPVPRGMTSRIHRSDFLKEGLAEWIAAGVVTGEGKDARWVPGPLEPFHRSTVRGPLRMPLSEVVQIYRYGRLATRVRLLNQGQPGDKLNRYDLRHLVASHAAAFVHFCHEHQDGTYLPALRAYVRWEWGGDPERRPPTDSRVAGEHCLRAFERCFGDSAALEIEFRTWLSK